MKNLIQEDCDLNFPRFAGSAGKEAGRAARTEISAETRAQSCLSSSDKIRQLVN